MAAAVSEICGMESRMVASDAVADIPGSGGRSIMRHGARRNTLKTCKSPGTL